AGLPAILAIVPPDTIPDEAEIALNRSVLIFTLTLSALTSVVCGLAPALHSSRRDLAVSMREVSRTLSGGSGQALLRKSLVGGAAANPDPVVVHQVDAGYATVFGLHLASGRSISDEDIASRRPIAVINERFVRTRFEGRPPLGQIVRLPRLKERPFDLVTDA